ncbi:DUF423 domain-containing protein [Pusillimonas sp.]|uniref:DUF423 domain-containing protein n=1 Tax=Pusillimonas sp. TaxID=3040095 RepID=UPI0037CC2F78
MSDRSLVITAALCLMVGVGAGAFGAHALKRIVSADMLQVWQTAVLYQLIHGLGMLAIAALAARFGSPLLSWAGTLMFAGIILFSGSLYVLALSGTKWLGAVTPLGGVFFIIAWALVALAAWRHVH